jgi:hypothetical protein
MGDISFRVLDMATWPASAALAGSRTTATNLPAALRRRVTAIGREALEAAWTVLPPDRQIRMVFASRHGEYQRTLGLLSALAEEGAVSPADFSMSVHHALAGLLSIVTGNRAGHTAVAAGSDSFCYGLLEAAACLADDAAPVMFVYFDEPLPAVYGATAAVGDVAPIALALILAAASDNDDDRLALSVTAKASGPTVSVSQAREFLDFLTSGRSELRLSGERHDWWWRRAA